MKKLNQNDKRMFEQIVALSQKGIYRTMKAFLSKKYETIYCMPEYIYAVGDIPIALVAHMDTVFKVRAQNIYYDAGKNVMWCSEGLGADDRAGIFAIIKILQTGLRPSIILTTDEEIGGRGATAFARDWSAPVNEVNYLIELDRRGTSDCVFYDCDNPEFTEYIESFGFVENYGSYTDICEICSKWGIAGVNLSIGYEDEHQLIETLHFNAFFSTIEKVLTMLQVESIPSFSYIPATRSPYFKFLDNEYEDYGLLDNHTSYGHYCSKCKKLSTMYDLFPVYGADGTTQYWCADCIPAAEWCEYCQEAFEPDSSASAAEDDLHGILCPFCREKLFPNRVEVEI